MGFLDIFKNKQEVEKEPKRSAKLIKKTTSIQQLYRFNQEINSWKNGVTAFEDEYNSTTVDLIRVYNDVIIDAHLTAAIENRISNVLSKDFKLVDEKGDEIKDETNILNKAWFRDFIRYSLESKFFGYSLIQFGNRIGTSFEDVTIVPREYVYPQKQAVRHSPYDTMKTIPFNSGEYQAWLIGVGKPNNLGLLMKAAPLVIFKKTALGSWTEFAELFGTPFRMGKTNVRDEELRDNMFAMLRDMGRNAFGVFDMDDTIEFIQEDKTDSHHVYDELVKRVNSELSKLILGSTMIMDDGSSRSQAEVHQKNYEAIIKDDCFFIEDLVNNTLIPHLNRFHGFNIKGKYIYDNAENLSKSEQFKIDLELLKLGYIIPETYLSATYGTPLKGKESNEKSEEDSKKKTPLATTYENFISEFSCDICNEIEDVPDPIWEQAFIDEILLGFYSGKYVKGKLPVSLYEELATKIMDSVYSGIGVDTIAEIKNPEFVKLIQDNVYTFSGAKTAAQAEEYSKFILDENGKRRTFKQYKEKASEIFDQFNKNWLKTELNHAFASAQNGDKWQQYENEKDVLPYLKYRTAGDGRVRDEHKALNGVIKLVDDKFWDVYYPPNGWNCRCSVQQLEDGKPTNDSEIKLPPIAPEMRGNSGKKGIIFNSKHPYFEAATAKDKMTNFGLPDAPDKLVKNGK